MQTVTIAIATCFLIVCKRRWHGRMLVHSSVRRATAATWLRSAARAAPRPPWTPGCGALSDSFERTNRYYFKKRRAHLYWKDHHLSVIAYLSAGAVSLLSSRNKILLFRASLSKTVNVVSMLFSHSWGNTKTIEEVVSVVKYHIVWGCIAVVLVFKPAMQGHFPGFRVQ